MAVKSMPYQYPVEFIVPTNLESEIGPLGNTIETEFLHEELPIGLREDDMRNGVIVVGSNILERFLTNAKIVYESVKKNIPYIIISSNKNYRRLADFIPTMKIFRLGEDISIGPLDTEGVPAENYIPFFIEMLRLSVNFSDEIVAAISTMLKNVYEMYGNSPAMNSFTDELWNGVMAPEISYKERNEFNAVYKYIDNLLSGETTRMIANTKKNIYEIVSDAPALIEIDVNDKRSRRFLIFLILIKIITLSKFLNYRDFMILIDDGDLIFGMEQPKLYIGRNDDPHFSLLNWMSTLRRNDIGIHTSIQYPSLIIPQILSNFLNIIVHRTHSFEESQALRSLLNLSFRPREEGTTETYSEKRKYQYQYEYLRVMEEGEALLNRPDVKSCFPIMFDYLNFDETHVLKDEEIQERLKMFYPDWDFGPIFVPERSAIERSFHQYAEHVKNILSIATEYDEIMYGSIQSATGIEDEVLRVLLHKLIQLRFLIQSQEVLGVTRRNTYKITELGVQKLLEYSKMKGEISEDDFRRQLRERGFES